jgi:hypothetical protein
MKIILFALLAWVLSVSAIAQQADFENAPGHVDFASLNEIYGEPRVMINIGGPLMQLMAAAAASSDDPQVGALMRELEGVRINVYDTVGNLAPALAQMAEAKSALEAEQWQPVIQVKEEKENVQMFSKIEGGLMQGLAVMVVNEEEAVFLNILGTIDPAQVSKLMGHLNVDVDVDAEGE